MDELAEDDTRCTLAGQAFREATNYGGRRSSKAATEAAGMAVVDRGEIPAAMEPLVLSEQLVQPDRLRDRIVLWTEEEARAGTLPAKSGQVLEAVLFRGGLPRGDVPALLGASERAARRLGPARSRRARIRKHARALADRLSGDARGAMDARPVPGARPARSTPGATLTKRGVCVGTRREPIPVDASCF